MPDNTGRDARMKNEDVASGDADRKVLLETISTLMSKVNLDDKKKQELGFVMPATDSEPEKFVRLCDLEKSLGDMFLVHEIALNEHFTLEPPSPETDPIRHQILNQVKVVYFDLLREELSQEPPCFSMVVELLKDVKESFKSLLSGNNDRTLEKINVVLDETQLQNMIEAHGMSLLDYKCMFVINVMAMACSPARDEEIAIIRSETDRIAKLRGIMEMLDKMKMDMANYVLGSARNQFVRYSVEYEKCKFAELQALHDNNFSATAEWLKRNRMRMMNAGQQPEPNVVPGPSTNVPMVRLLGGKTLMPYYFIDAYLELFEPQIEELKFPELLRLDMGRLMGIKDEALRLATCATVMQLTNASVPTLVHDLRRKDLAQNLNILAKEYPRKCNLADTLESLWLQVNVTVTEHAKANDGNAPSESVLQLLKAQIVAVVAEPPSVVYGVVWKKLLTFLKQVICTENATDATFPSSFNDYREELTKIGLTYKKIIGHNFAVYGEYYLKQHD